MREQLDRMLSSPLFSLSRRYSKLLRYIVEQTLEGHAEQLKERTLGVEVFGRDPAYDTNDDPVVRTTAAQLRRRVAQYYFQVEHEGELVIELPVGAYIAEFRRPPHAAGASETACHTAGPPDLDVNPAPPEIAPLSAPLRSRRRALLLSLVAILAIILVSLALRRPSSKATSVEQFWGPVWDSSNYILLVMGYASGDEPSVPLKPNASIVDSLIANRVAWPDAITLSSLVGIVRANGKAYRLRRAASTTFSDLRDSPAILIGGFNNPWIMRLGASLRFHYVADWDRGVGWIEDTQKPSQRTWSVHFKAPFSTFDKDYGVITRVKDPTTEQMIVIASGIASYGTIAAGEFLANEDYLRMVAERAPKGWEHKNVQVVFSTDVINGNSGPPQIVASYSGSPVSEPRPQGNARQAHA